jgi:hypothetical protein
MSIWAESSDNNAIVCKPEYFNKYYDRPCEECLLRCVSRVTKVPHLLCHPSNNRFANGFNNRKHS